MLLPSNAADPASMMAQALSIYKGIAAPKAQGNPQAGGGQGEAGGPTQSEKLATGSRSDDGKQKFGNDRIAVRASTDDQAYGGSRGFSLQAQNSQPGVFSLSSRHGSS